VEPQDDLKKQLKLWGSIAAMVCLFGAIFGYCKGQKNKKLVEVVPTVIDTTKIQIIEKEQITVASIPDVIPATLPVVSNPVPTTTPTSTTTPAKKSEKDKPKSSKPASTTSQNPHNNSEWTVAPAAAPTPVTPTKPATLETTQVAPVKTESTKPILASSLDNMSDFTGEKGLIHKHLNKIDCNNFTLSFVIKANGMIADPQWVKGDEKCKTAALSQVRSMPQLKTPIYDKKPADYKYFFTKR
jgi:hypothetical protein